MTQSAFVTCAGSINTSGGTSTEGSYTFPASVTSGHYLVVAGWTGTSAGSTSVLQTAKWTAVSGCSLLTRFNNSSLSTLVAALLGQSSANIEADDSAMTAWQFSMTLVSVSSASAVIAFADWGINGNRYMNSNLDNLLFVLQVDPAFVN